MATNRQKALARKIAENPSLTMKDAMLSVGYSENTAIAPQNVTESKAWPELLEKYLPDSRLAKKHDEILEATKQLSVRGGKDANAETDDFIEVPDYPTQIKALELGYKVKGKLNEQPSQTNNILVIPGELIKKYDKTTT